MTHGINLLCHNLSLAADWQQQTRHFAGSMYRIWQQAPLTYWIILGKHKLSLVFHLISLQQNFIGTQNSTPLKEKAYFPCTVKTVAGDAPMLWQHKDTKHQQTWPSLSWISCLWTKMFIGLSSEIFWLQYQNAHSPHKTWFGYHLPAKHSSIWRCVYMCRT